MESMKTPPTAADIGRLGGQARSERKLAAARANLERARSSPRFQPAVRANVAKARAALAARQPPFPNPSTLRGQHILSRLSAGESQSAIAADLGISRQRLHQLLNPERAAARKAVRRALSTGTIKRPDTCSDCSTPSITLHAHHDDYSEPLNVRWLCPTCHLRRHATHPNVKSLSNP